MPTLGSAEKATWHNWCWKQGFLGTLLNGPLRPGHPGLPMAPFPVGPDQELSPIPPEKKEKKKKTNSPQRKSF